MEKINYTEYRINSDPEESEFFLIERTVEDGVFTEGVKLSSPYKEEIEKIVTLYEQHFKMLEALKKIEASAELAIHAGHVSHFACVELTLQLVKQTINDCDL